MNLVYNASAGTGKTWQVTQLYEQLVVQDGIDPHAILLMTFTDNAAAELRTRVTHRLLKTQRCAEDPEQADRIARALTSVSAAPIETIHSFCTRLLREHALEAGLSPGFSILSGEERDECLREICQTELLLRLESDPDFKTFCSGALLAEGAKGFGVSVPETAFQLVDDADSLGILLDRAEEFLTPPRESGSLSAFSNICTRLKELQKPTAKATAVLRSLETHLPASKNSDELAEHLQKEALPKFGQGKGQKPISDEFWQLLDEVRENSEYRKRFPAARAFARYLGDVSLRFRQSKHERNEVDFGDLLRLAGNLLRSGRAMPDFTYVIVDEVQDTSRVQYDIIRQLCSPNTSLVICGDRKQGIYTWRGADPQVMPDLEEEIRQSGDFRITSLQTSYRSKEPLIDVVNALFQSVFKDPAYTETEHLQPHPDYVTEGEKPCVEFLLSDVDESLERNARVAAEMEAVANRIQLLTGPVADPKWRPAYRFNGSGFALCSENNRYRYSDILILLRRTTHQSALEHALRKAHIPYTLGGKGRGLFTRQETRDISLFLNVITNPADTLSLIGFLRSPWIGMSDTDIAELAWSEAGFSAEELSRHFDPDTDEDPSHISSERYRFARQTLSKYRALLGTRLASELVRLLITETGYDALLAGLPRGTQRLANLRKVLDWLRACERGARTTPATAARKLADRIARPPNVPEAALLDPDQNAVTLMTVHSAKGLTQSVVFVPDMSARNKNNTAFAHVHAETGQLPRLNIKVSAPDKSAAASPGFAAANRESASVRDQESRNLFYVAMTRARDLVVTSATLGKSAEGWYKEMEPLIGSTIPAIPYSALQKAAAQLPEEPLRKHEVQHRLQPPECSREPAFRRIAATQLAKQESGHSGRIYRGDAADDAAALGSLGHAVLEQLALNGWEGSVEEWIDRLREPFDLEAKAAATLKDRIESARTLMRSCTADCGKLIPEMPFVLHEGDRLIDGTIDLLCHKDRTLLLFDYKFTDADDAAVCDAYRGQMDIYRNAAQRAFPESGAPEVTLVVIDSTGARLVPVDVT